VSFYERYTGDGTEVRIAEAIEAQIGSDQDDGERKQQELKAQLTKLDGTIRRVLDNISDVNADAANKRVAELSIERDHIAAHIESIRNKLLAAQDVQHLIEDVRLFCSELAKMLRSEQPDERQIAARRCVESIEIDKANKDATLSLRTVPTTVLGQHGATTATISISLNSQAPISPLKTTIQDQLSVL
jgi:DNA-binding TFAR19-related protein (PDSD5 family)